MAKIMVRLSSFMIVFAFGLVGVFSSIGWSMMKGIYKNISADQFVKMVDQKDFTLINVHIPYEGEIARTDFLIPFNKIEHYKNLLPEDKDAKMVVYCLMGPMGHFASEKLAGMGYTQVIHLEGGMRAWQNSGKKLQFRSD